MITTPAICTSSDSTSFSRVSRVARTAESVEQAPHLSDIGFRRRRHGSRSQQDHRPALMIPSLQHRGQAVAEGGSHARSRTLASRPRRVAAAKAEVAGAQLRGGFNVELAARRKRSRKAESLRCGSAGGGDREELPEFGVIKASSLVHKLDFGAGHPLGNRLVQLFVVGHSQVIFPIADLAPTNETDAGLPAVGLATATDVHVRVVSHRLEAGGLQRVFQQLVGQLYADEVGKAADLGGLVDEKVLVEQHQHPGVVAQGPPAQVEVEVVRLPVLRRLVDHGPPEVLELAGHLLREGLGAVKVTSLGLRITMTFFGPPPACLRCRLWYLAGRWVLSTRGLGMARACSSGSAPPGGRKSMKGDRTAWSVARVFSTPYSRQDTISWARVVPDFRRFACLFLYLLVVDLTTCELEHQPVMIGQILKKSGRLRALLDQRLQKLRSCLALELVAIVRRGAELRVRQSPDSSGIYSCYVERPAGTAGDSSWDEAVEPRPPIPKLNFENRRRKAAEAAAAADAAAGIDRSQTQVIGIPDVLDSDDWQASGSDDDAGGLDSSRRSSQQLYLPKAPPNSIDPQTTTNFSKLARGGAEGSDDDEDILRELEDGDGYNRGEVPDRRRRQLSSTTTTTLAPSPYSSNASPPGFQVHTPPSHEEHQQVQWPPQAAHVVRQQHSMTVNAEPPVQQQQPPEARRVIGNLAYGELTQKNEHGQLLVHKLAREGNWPKVVAFNQRQLSNPSFGDLFAGINTPDGSGRTVLLEAVQQQNAKAVAYCCLFTSSSDRLLLPALAEGALLPAADEEIFLTVLTTLCQDLDVNGLQQRHRLRTQLGCQQQTLAVQRADALLQLLSIQSYDEHSHSRLSKLISSCGADPRRPVSRVAAPEFRPYSNCPQLAARFSPDPLGCLQALGLTTPRDVPILQGTQLTFSWDTELSRYKELAQRRLSGPELPVLKLDDVDLPTVDEFYNMR
uniref:Uncharacterized protein n=1 Tax=Macrostomum lignano TaxID=282301 RepID=A0A1I8II34_9PLAT